MESHMMSVLKSLVLQPTDGVFIESHGNRRTLKIPPGTKMKQGLDHKTHVPWGQGH